MEAIFFRKSVDPRTQYWNNEGIARPPILCISSKNDEAWQVLHHVIKFDNPIKPDGGLIHFLTGAHRDYVARSWEIERARGAAVMPDRFDAKLVAIAFGLSWFYPIIVLLRVGISNLFAGDLIHGVGFIVLTIFLCILLVVLASVFDDMDLFRLPRWFVRQGRATLRVVYDIGNYVVRKRGWLFFREMALGLEGYRLGLPQPIKELKFGRSVICTYEDLSDLSKEAEDRALLRREEWMKRSFGSVTKTLAEMAATDLKSLLKVVETDLSLVHAAYYTDDECIARIAKWIAGKG